MEIPNDGMGACSCENVMMCVRRREENSRERTEKKTVIYEAGVVLHSHLRQC